MISFILKELWQGKSIARSYMNAELQRRRFVGRTFDLGGGKDSSYLSFHADGSRVETFDVKAGQVIDFETDALPVEDGTYDTVLLFNVLEHVFNYQHLLDETIRITKHGGEFHGFVPFLVEYHPDPHDFFRYTEETLHKLLTRAGWREVDVVAVGAGPFVAAVQQLTKSFPWILRIPLFLLFWLPDALFLKLRPDARRKFPLGYYWNAKKGS